MLDSERVQTLPVDARWLYLSILLTADDVGLFEVANFKLSRRAGIDQKAIPVLTQLLADVDLVRLYQVAGKSFGFIPRYRQRLQIKRTRHPLPPVALMADDEDALRKINSLVSNPPLDNGESRISTAAQPPEPEPEPEEETIAPTALAERQASGLRQGYRVPDCPYAEVIELYHAALPTLSRCVLPSKGRNALIRSRWADVCAAEKWAKPEGLTFFGEFFAGVAQSRFLTGREEGRNRRPFKADLEWLMKPSNFTKTLEGKYA